MFVTVRTLRFGISRFHCTMLSAIILLTTTRKSFHTVSLFVKGMNVGKTLLDEPHTSFILKKMVVWINYDSLIHDMKQYKT